MTALAASRVTDRKGNNAITEQIDVPLGANKKVYGGGMVVVAAATGLGQAGDNSAATLRIMGIALKDAGATSGQAAGDVICPVRRGAFYLNNSVSDPVTQVDVGKTVYIEDDNTIAKTAGSLSAAGTLLEVPPSTDFRYGQVLVQISGPAMP